MYKKKLNLIEYFNINNNIIFCFFYLFIYFFRLEKIVVVLCVVVEYIGLFVRNCVFVVGS